LQALTVSVALLGLAVAFSSPTSVLAVLLLLGMPSGLRRSFAFLAGWLVTIALIGVVVVAFPSTNFSSSQTTPSRTASIAEILIGAFLIIGAIVLQRRPVVEQSSGDPLPGWLVRLVGRHWAVALAAGGVMLTYSVTVAAAIEILKANVNTVDRAVAIAVFAVTSIVSVAAPIAFTLVAPRRAAADLDSWRQWLIRHSRTIGVVLLLAIGAALIIKASYDLTS
jgi:hypothetical protein